MQSEIFCFPSPESLPRPPPDQERPRCQLAAIRSERLSLRGVRCFAPRHCPRFSGAFATDQAARAQSGENGICGGA